MEVTQTQKPLSDSERERLTSKGGVPHNIEFWARGVGLNPNPSQQQIATARSIFDMPYHQRHKITIWEDQVVQRTNVVNYSYDHRLGAYKALKY